MNIKSLNIALTFSLFVYGCAAQKIELQPGSSKIAVSTEKPGSNYKYVGALSATHGNGCGAFGSRGNYQDAVAILKNKALNLKADYIRIKRITEPHLRRSNSEFQCFDNEYIISASAYRKISNAEKNSSFKEKVDNLALKLKEIKRLHDEGLISESEYKQMKQKIINKHKLTDK